MTDKSKHVADSKDAQAKTIDELISDLQCLKQAYGGDTRVWLCGSDGPDEFSIEHHDNENGPAELCLVADTDREGWFANS